MAPSLPENQSQHGKAVLTENSEARDGKEIDQETEEWTAMVHITQNSRLILELVYPQIIVVGSSPTPASKSAPALSQVFFCISNRGWSRG